MDFCPRAFAIDYSDIANNMICKFVQDCGQSFSSDGNGRYVFSGKETRKILKELFSAYLSKELLSIAESINQHYSDKFATRHVYVIQSCDPEDNILSKGIHIDPLAERYSLKENDIKMDFELIGNIWNDLFDKRFKTKQLGRNYGIVFLKHSRLNFEQISNILRQMYDGIILPYGRNVDVLDDLNDSIDFKFDGRMTNEMKVAIGEVKDYVRQKRNMGE